MSALSNVLAHIPRQVKNVLKLIKFNTLNMYKLKIKRLDGSLCKNNMKSKSIVKFNTLNM